MVSRRKSKAACLWNFFGCGCRRRCKCSCWNYNNDYGGCRNNYGHKEHSSYGGYKKGGGHGNYNCKDGYDGHKNHHSVCKCKQDGYSDY